MFQYYSKFNIIAIFLKEILVHFDRTTMEKNAVKYFVCRPKLCYLI